MSVDGNGKNGEADTELLRMLLDAVNTLTTELVATRVDLGARIDNTNARLDETNAELKGLRGVVEELEVDVRGLRGDVEELEVDVRGLRNDVSELRVDVRAVRTATTSGFELLARTDARLGTTDHELRDRVERIEQHLGLRPA